MRWYEGERRLLDLICRFKIHYCINMQFDGYARPKTRMEVARLTILTDAYEHRWCSSTALA